MPKPRSWGEVFGDIFRKTGVLPFWRDVDLDLEEKSEEYLKNVKK
jgi:hypothetical protein